MISRFRADKVGNLLAEGERESIRRERELPYALPLEILLLSH
jgi:hypothetical protein